MPVPAIAFGAAKAGPIFGRLFGFGRKRKARKRMELAQRAEIEEAKRLQLEKRADEQRHFAAIEQQAREQTRQKRLLTRAVFLVAAGVGLSLIFLTVRMMRRGRQR